MTYKEAYEKLVEYLSIEYSVAAHYALNCEQYNLNRDYMIGRRDVIGAMLQRAEEYDKEGIQ